MIVARRTERTSRAARRLAFTLMEVMVVVAILVILASVAGVAVFKYLDDANESAAKLKIQSIETAVNSYKLKHGDFPQSLEALTVQSDAGSHAYLEQRDIIDPWGKEYQYNPGQLSTTGKPYIGTTTPSGAPISNQQQ
jgi:general secretion pathway protein G